MEIEKELRAITNDLAVIADRSARQEDLLNDPEIPQEVFKYLHAYTQKHLQTTSDRLQALISTLNAIASIEVTK